MADTFKLAAAYGPDRKALPPLHGLPAQVSFVCTSRRTATQQTENRSIVNVSSTTGLHGNVGQINYAAAKAAVVGMSKTITKEWGVFGVRANTVAFGFVQTR